ncbi:MAG: YfhO family protein [Blastocatellia bacterium]|nr:YfhO family protein [Blastocatellia bacterium]
MGWMRQQGTEANRERATYGLLVILPFAFFWRETLGWITLGDQDAVFWFFPAYKFVVGELRQGHLPLWTPFLYAGAPLLAEWQAGVFDPLNWLHLLGAGSRTLTTSLQLTFSLALCGTFRYARAIGFTRRAALVSALIYGFGGFIVGRTLYPGFLHIVALAPLVLSFVERLHQARRWRDCAGGAAVVAWQVFGAHPQPLIYSSLLACAYALFCAFPRRDPAPRALRDRLGFLFQFALIFVAGAALAAAQLLPAAEFARDSVRKQWPYELFTLHSLHPISLLTQLFPFLHGTGQAIYRMPYWGPYWHHNEAQIYLGALALALALAGGLAAWRRRCDLMVFWSFVAIAGVLLSMGRYVGPLAKALFHVPVLGQFRSPNRHWMEVALAVAVLAGYAVDRLLREEAARLARGLQWISLGLAIFCAIVGGTALWRRGAAESLIRSLPDLHVLPPDFLREARMEFLLPPIVALAACGAVWLFARRRRYWILPLFLLVDFQLYAVFAPIGNPARLETLVGRAMPPALAEKQQPRDPIRYHVMLNTASGEFSPFWFYGHEMTSGYDPILNESVKTFLGIDEAGRTFNATMLEAEDRTLDLLNARYVLVAPVYFDSGAAKVSGAGVDVELRRGRSADFSAREGAADVLEIVSSLANSAAVGDGEPVADVIVGCASGEQWTTSLRAGLETAEWAYDRPDVRAAIRHARPPIAESWSGDSAASFDAHAYRARLALPANVSACRAPRTVRIVVRSSEDLALTLRHLSFVASATKETIPLVRTAVTSLDNADRWRALPDRSSAEPYRAFRIYENLRALPRVWLTPRARAAWPGDQLKMIRGEIPGFDPRAVALVEPATAERLDPALLRSDEAPRESVPVFIHERRPTRMRVEAAPREASILIFSEIDYPGWRVFVDGREADLLRVDYHLRGVALAPGTHQVEMTYRPRSFLLGAIVSATTAMAMLGLFLAGRWRLN